MQLASICHAPSIISKSGQVSVRQVVRIRTCVRGCPAIETRRPQNTSGRHRHGAWRPLKDKDKGADSFPTNVGTLLCCQPCHTITPAAVDPSVQTCAFDCSPESAVPPPPHYMQGGARRCRCTSVAPPRAAGVPLLPLLNVEGHDHGWTPRQHHAAGTASSTTGAVVGKGGHVVGRRRKGRVRLRALGGRGGPVHAHVHAGGPHLRSAQDINRNTGTGFGRQARNATRLTDPPPGRVWLKHPNWQ